MNKHAQCFWLCLLLSAALLACGNKGDLTRETPDSDETTAEQTGDTDDA